MFEQQLVILSWFFSSLWLKLNKTNCAGKADALKRANVKFNVDKWG